MLESLSIAPCSKTLELYNSKLLKKLNDLERKFLLTSSVPRNDQRVLKVKSVQMAKKLATHFYLNELQKLNMVTPSIAVPYPSHPLTEEKLFIHAAHRRVHTKMIEDLKIEIDLYKCQGISPCRFTMSQERRRLWNKVMFLRKKFLPLPKASKRRRLQRPRSDKTKSKKSKERHLVRQFRKKMEEYKNCVESRNVFNLSSIDLPIIDLFSLEYGHGFVLSPRNKVKEEELLVLEGFRFLDRLGKADQDKVNDEKPSFFLF